MNTPIWSVTIEIDGRDIGVHRDQTDDPAMAAVRAIMQSRDKFPDELFSMTLRCERELGSEERAAP